MTRRPYVEALERCRRRVLRWALRMTGGRVARAAKLLALNRNAMYVLMRRHGVDPQEFRTLRGGALHREANALGEIAAAQSAGAFERRGVEVHVHALAAGELWRTTERGGVRRGNRLSPRLLLPSFRSLQ